MELRDYLRVLRRGWLLIVLFVLVGVGASATYSLVLTPQYEAGTRVFVSADSAANVGELGAGNTYTQQIVRSFVEVVGTAAVLEPVIDELDLDTTVGGLASQVTASSDLNTVILNVTVQDPDPVQAADIANAVTASLVDVVGTLTPQTAEGTTPIAVNTVQPATVPESPVSPRVPLNIALGLLVGLALGVGIAVLREVLDTRVRGERDIEQVLDVPLLGGVAFDPKAKERPLIVQVDPKSPRAEAFRTLRTNLQFLELGSTSRSFVITSSLQSEGKSTTTANLAITMRDSGQNVLIIDADLRRPKVHKYFGIEGAVGMTDVLLGRVNLEDAIQPWGPRELHVLPAGTIPPNPSELLGSAAMKQLIEVLSTRYDTILFDAPPLLPVTDAAILSKSASGAILVVAAGRVHKQQLAAAASALENVGARLLGAVPTLLPTKGPDAYGYGRYGYSYSYEEGKD